MSLATELTAVNIPPSYTLIRFMVRTGHSPGVRAQVCVRIGATLLRAQSAGIPVVSSYCTATLSGILGPLIPRA